jgi:diacylglycerol kinase family enzyme
VRITLLHNPDAGDGTPTKAELLGALEAAGFDARYQSTHEADFARALREPGDLVVVAGGDGAVGKVAFAHVQRAVPLAILPLGTANNIAYSLGVHGPWQSLVPSLASGATRRLHVGRVRAPWGTHEFLESAGIGLIAALLVDAAEVPSPRGTDKIGAGRRRFVRVIEAARPRWCVVEADGRDLSGEYLLVEAMNLPVVGPRVPLAPAADPGDGLLDLVRVAPHERDALLTYVRCLDDRTVTPPPLRAERVRAVRLRWDAGDGHVDDELWPHSSESGAARDRDAPLHVEVVADDAVPLRVVVGR